jgi:hypothetical protein
MLLSITQEKRTVNGRVQVVQSSMVKKAER